MQAAHRNRRPLLIDVEKIQGRQCFLTPTLGNGDWLVCDALSRQSITLCVHKRSTLTTSGL